MALFALQLNGKDIETLEELKENFNVQDMKNHFRAKRLHRWLTEKGFQNELKKIENIPNDDVDNLAELLMELFSLSDEQKNTVRLRIEDEARQFQEEQKVYASQNAQSISDMFDVILLGYSGDKIAMIKEVRGCSNADLKEAKILVESLPQTVIKNLSQDAAEAIKVTLECAGGTVKIRKSVEEVKKNDEKLKITWENDFYNSPTDHLVEQLHNLIVVAKEKIILCDGYNHFFESENGMTWIPIKIADDFYCHRVKKFNDKIVFFNTLPPQYGEFYTQEGTYVSTDMNLSYWNMQHTEPAVFDFYFDGSQFWAIDFNSRATAGILSHMTARDIDEIVIFKDKCIAAGLRDKDQQPAASLGGNKDERNVPFSSYIMTRDPDGRFCLRMTTPTEGRQKKYQHINLVAFDNAVFMMVRGTENEEERRTVYFSCDGEKWEKLNVGFDFVVKIDNVFFAYSKDYNSECYRRAISAIYYSVDGINWKMIEPPMFTEKADLGSIFVLEGNGDVKRIFLCDFIVYKNKLLGLLSNNKFVFGEVSAETLKEFSFNPVSEEQKDYSFDARQIETVEEIKEPESSTPSIKYTPLERRLLEIKEQCIQIFKDALKEDWCFFESDLGIGFDETGILRDTQWEIRSQIQAQIKTIYEWYIDYSPETVILSKMAELHPEAFDRYDIANIKVPILKEKIAEHIGIRRYEIECK